MLRGPILQELLALALGMTAQARLGLLGVLLLAMVGVGVRAKHTGLAVGAALMFTALMVQA